MKQGLLLINLGTPDSPDIPGIRRYLREFLADKRVIDLPFLMRYLLLYLFILPFRPRRTAHAYQAIWTNQGSPLLSYSHHLVRELQSQLGETYKIALGMRYGKPSLSNALKSLADCDQITILPLYPQYSSAATGSSLEKVMTLIAVQNPQPAVTIIRDFYQHPSFIKAQADLIRPYLASHDYVLLSYHGVPERHIVRSGCVTLCEGACPTQNVNEACYKAQCHHTSRALMNALQWPEDKWSMAFQSRLGKTPWIKPYLEEVLASLSEQGIKRLVISCPSFTIDCLETLEEIGIRANQQWQKLGGDKLTLVPCLNASSSWASAVLEISHLKGVSRQSKQA